MFGWVRNIRVWSAGCFLVMFLFIHAEKLLHTHRSTDHLVANNQSTVSSPKGCAICDFQLGKDAQLADPITVTIQFPPTRDIVKGYNSPILSFKVEKISGRGPPVI